MFMGFCAITKPNNSVLSDYVPTIKWLFVEEKFRGRRLGQELLDTAADYAKSLGFKKVFLTTWH